MTADDKADLVVAKPLVRVPCPICGRTATKPERVIRGYALERCRGCGLVFANPQETATDLLGEYEDRGDPEQLIAFYERVTTPERLAEYDRILDDLAALLPERGRLLDFGCGPGYFFERAQRHGWNAHGVEVGAWAALAAARRGLRNFHAGLLANQPFRDGEFDVVTVQQVLEHLPAPRTTLAEIGRVLRPGGVLYANVPNYRTLSILLGRDDFELNYPMAHVNYFTPATLARLLTACGFDVLRTTSSGGLKWENLLGRRTISEEVRAAHDEPPTRVNHTAVVPQGSQQPWLKRLVFPAVKKLFYEWAKVGMTLEVFAQKSV